MLHSVINPEIWASLLALTAMEIVLGIDNVVFLSLLVSRLPERQGRLGRQIGLALALCFRILLLLTISWIIHLREPLFTIWGEGFSWRDLILLAGGGFLLVKGTLEIHGSIEEAEELPGGGRKVASLGAIVVQIVFIDLVFSIDSIITAVGMAQHVEVMIAAVVVAIAIMYVASGPVAGFIAAHPTTKMLALAFLMLIGVALVADGLGFHIPRGYIYFAMAFSALVEMANVFARGRARERKRHIQQTAPDRRAGFTDSIVETDLHERTEAGRFRSEGKSSA